MLWVKIIFWFLAFTVFYVYAGYAVLLFLLVKTSKKKTAAVIKDEYLPEVTLFIAAYNEKDFVDKKIENCFELDYPREKLKFLWVTDGSDDGTEKILEKYPGIEVYHQHLRKGKIAAMNRGMQFVKTPLVVFSDANTLLNKESIKIIAHKFSDPGIGCVAGEKRIISTGSGNAASSGEGLYWKYESFLKKLDAELNSAVGGAGELFAIRTNLFSEVEPDTLLDDFIISLRIVARGYKIAYTPDAYASETSSANVKEELKRKIRISAGGIQSVERVGYLLNPFNYGIFAWQFMSHKVMRWLWVPFILPVIFALNLLLVLFTDPVWYNVYYIVFALQCLFYLLAFAGWILRDHNLSFRYLFAPYYVFIMNYSVYLGLFRYFRGKQSVNWERAKRA